MSNGSVDKTTTAAMQCNAMQGKAARVEMEASESLEKEKGVKSSGVEWSATDHHEGHGCSISTMVSKFIGVWSNTYDRKSGGSGAAPKCTYV